MVQGPMAMSDPNFGPLGDEANDDLPRTFRREKEARAREARERAAQERAAAPSLSTTPESRSESRHSPQPQMTASGPQLGDAMPVIADMPFPAAVTRFDVPFTQLVRFYLKAVFAAIPALILLGILLWFAGAGLKAVFPDLIKMKILISFPN